jgi:hypothetical protein
MIRNLKALGLAVFAVCAMGAIAASAASAQNALITSTGPVTLTGTETGNQANRLESFGAFVECPGSTYTGHEVGSLINGVPSGATTATITPHYKQTTAAGAPNCVGSLGTSATVDVNGCDYVIHSGETTESSPPPAGTAATYGATFDVVCPGGQSIKVTVWLSESAHTSEPASPKCILTIPAQTGLKGGHLTETSLTDGHIELTGTVTGITVEQTRNSILCPSGTETKEGKFKLDVTVSGDNSIGSPTAVSLSHA